MLVNSAGIISPSGNQCLQGKPKSGIGSAVREPLSLDLADTSVAYSVVASEHGCDLDFTRDSG